MGLGKTAILLSALEPRHLPALVIAPKRVAHSVWPQEARLWRPDLSVSLASGSPQRRFAGMAAPADITVMTRDVTGDLRKFGGHGMPARRWKTLIVDESSSVKNKNTSRWRNVASWLRSQDTPAHVWLSSGTPSPNHLIDLWAQIWMLDQGDRLERTLGGYRGRYFTPGQQLSTGVVTSYTPRPEAPAKIHDLLSDILVSMESVDYLPDLPEQVDNRIEIDLPEQVKATYKAMKDRAVCEVAGEQFSASTAGALSNRLTQITAGFLYRHPDDADTLDEALRREELSEKEAVRLHTSKVEAITEVVEGSSGGVLIFYRYRAELRMLKKAFPEAETVDAPDVIERWNNGDVPMLLAHPASAGHGLNLQHGGHTIIWSSLPWSLEEWMQANKRLQRQGQKNTVVIHRLIVPGTVDEVVERALNDKKDVQQALLDYVAANPVAVRRRRVEEVLATLI